MGMSPLDKDDFYDAVERRKKGMKQKSTVRTVWAANLASLRAGAPAALELLQLVSVVHPERIPREFARMAAVGAVKYTVEPKDGERDPEMRYVSFDDLDDYVEDRPQASLQVGDEVDVPAKGTCVITGMEAEGCGGALSKAFGGVDGAGEQGRVVTGELLQSLARYSLVRVHGNSGGGGRGSGGDNGENGAATFTVHRLLQQVIRDDLGERRSKVVKVAVRVCTEGISGDWQQGWSEEKDKWYR